MDPITHSLVGALAAKTVRASRRRFWIMALLAVVPDLDFLANSLGSWASILQHRGLTHSLFGLILFSLCFAWILRRFDQGPFAQRARDYSLPWAFHIFGDYLTGFGVPLFSPFILNEYSLNLVTAITWIPLLITISALVWLHRQKKEGWVHTRPIWALWGLYLVLTLSGKVYASKIVSTSASVTTLPTFYNPFAWRAIEIDDETHSYHHYEINLLKRQKRLVFIFPQPNGDFPVKASMDSLLVQDFLKENRFPVVRALKNGDQWEVEWGTLLFSTRGTARSKVLVNLSLEGKILSSQKSFGFWNPQIN